MFSDAKFLDINNKFERLSNDLRVINLYVDTFFNKISKLLNSIYNKYLSIDEYLKNKDIDYYKEQVYLTKRKIFGISITVKQLFDKYGNGETSIDYKTYEDITPDSVIKISSILEFLINNSNLGFILKSRLKSMRKELNQLIDPFKMYADLILSEPFDEDFINYLKKVNLDKTNFNDNSVKEVILNIKKYNC